MRARASSVAPQLALFDMGNETSSPHDPDGDPPSPQSEVDAEAPRARAPSRLARALLESQSHWDSPDPDPLGTPDVDEQDKLWGSDADIAAALACDDETLKLSDASVAPSAPASSPRAV